nr:hypothetical protein [Microbacterium karelineae]
MLDERVGLEPGVVAAVMDPAELHAGKRADVADDLRLEHLVEELRIGREAIDADAEGGAREGGLGEQELGRAPQARP